MNIQYKNQKGAVTLIVAVMLLVILTLVTIYSARVGLQDQKISGNDFRAKSSFSAAQAGLDYGEAYLKTNSNTFISDATPCINLANFPCNYEGAVLNTWNFFVVANDLALTSGGEFDVGYLIAPDNFVTIIATGSSDDFTGNAVMREQVSIRSVLNTGPVPPVMAVGVSAGGTFTVIGNPDIETDASFEDAAGNSATGQLFSTWSENPQNIGGSLQTCKPGDFVDGSGVQCVGPTIEDAFGQLPDWNQCACTADEVISSTNAGGTIKGDIVESPANAAFDDTFAYVFAMSRIEMKSIATEIPNCDSLDETSGQADPNIYWVTGNCEKNGGEIGSQDDPVIVIVVGDISFQGQAHAWGIMMGIDGSENPPVESNCLDFTDIKVVGGFSMHGALISDCTLDLGAGTFNAMYDPKVFDNLKNNTNSTFLSRNVGSWRDF